VANDIGVVNTKRFVLNSFFVLFDADDLEIDLECRQISCSYNIFADSSSYDDAQIKKEIVQIGPFVFELSAFLYFFRHMTFNLTLKVKEFRGHLFLKS
jgi:hypothetical protein